MGCLSNILKTIILVFAVIGFLSIGGKEIIIQKWNEFVNPPQDVMLEKAKKVGDFSKIPDEFEIDKATSIMGYNGVLAEHRASGQKMFVVDGGKNPILSPEDFEEDIIQEKIENITDKLKYSVVNVKDLKITRKGYINSYGQKNPYVKFSAKISKIPLGDVEGIISAVDLENEQSRLLLSINEKGKYSQLISQNFFNNVKK